MGETLGGYALGMVHHADCLGAMRELPDFGGVCITDPPWPCAIGEQLARGDTFDLFMRAMDLLRGKIRRLVVLISDMSDPRWLASVPEEWPFVRVCWARYTPPSYCGTVLRAADVAYVFGDRSRPHGATVMPGETAAVSMGHRDAFAGDHPTPRNRAVMAFLVRWFSNPGEIVLDPFSGTGVTGAAAVGLGRRFLGFEVDPRWVDLANRRIAAEHERLGEVRPESAKANEQIGLLAGMEAKP